jgi:hypothetical protein
MLAVSAFASLAHMAITGPPIYALNDKPQEYKAMPDTHISLTDKVAALSHPEKLFFDTILATSEKNIFVAIKDLRKSQENNEVEPQYRAAASLALTAMTGHLNGDELPRQKTDSEALTDLQDRIRAAAASGDRETYDRLRAGLAHVSETAIANDERNAERIQKLEASRDAMEAETKSTYENMVKDWRDAEILKLRRGGMKADEAEAHYETWSAKPMELAARKASGYSHREPISLEE